MHQIFTINDDGKVPIMLEEHYFASVGGLGGGKFDSWLHGVVPYAFANKQR